MSATLAGSPPTLDLSVDFDEDGAGLVSRALQLPVESPLRVHLAMNGPLEAWTGRLEVACGADVLLQGDQTIAVADDRIDADVRLRVTPTPGLIPPAAEAITADGVELLLRAGLVDRQRVEVAEARLTARGVDLHASGGRGLRRARAGPCAALEARKWRSCSGAGVSGAVTSMYGTRRAAPAAAALRFAVANLVRRRHRGAGGWRAGAFVGTRAAARHGDAGRIGRVHASCVKRRGASGRLTWRLDAAYGERSRRARAGLARRGLVSATLRADFSCAGLAFEARSRRQTSPRGAPQLAEASGAVGALRRHRDPGRTRRLRRSR